MPEIPFIPENAPFNAEQRAWINGYLAGFFSNADGTQPSGSATPAPALEPLTILFGSQTGTAESIAKRLGKEAGAHGFKTEILELNDYEKANLNAASRLAIITSTWGDGDPPDNAVAFWDFISSDSAPKFENLSYSVLALGDSNYSEFCGAGRKFDEKLEALGAKRIHPRVDCDVDYDEPADGWIKGFWEAVKSTVTNGASNGAVAPAAAEETEPAKPDGYSRKNPFPAKLLTKLKLNGEGSSKDTRHFEISLEGSGLEYEVGDALGVVPANCPELVDDLIKLIGAGGEEAVTTPDGSETALRHALSHNFVITQPTKKLLQAVVEKAPDSALVELLKPENKADLEKHLWGREVYDVLAENPSAKFTPAEFVDLLNKLQPRLYSISSSPKAHPGEVHLTVGVVTYESHGRRRKGVCSTFLADRVSDETPLPVFVQKSHGFRLPESGDTPVIMVGPGTGIAPFRAFLEERKATGSKGRNWLFFGDQHEATDFLYREQLGAFQSEGFLTRLSLAFSRDQHEKIYVQNRMTENAEELFKWLEEGAHFYVCGDAKRMAKDVDAALHKVIETVGGRSPEEAAEYVNALKKDKRYQRDVY